MSGTNRSSLIAKIYKVLKQHYKPILPDRNRPLLEQMLFACCLENATYDKAEKIYGKLRESFFDWNEVRVSTVKELAETMRDLPDPQAAASNLKSVLQTAFEATYSFDLESVKKQNIGAGIKRLAKMEGASPFVVAFATQQALGGHSIPLDRGALDILYIVGIATEAEHESANVAGLERAIPKNKGVEFGSLLHQFAADYMTNPYSPSIKTLLLGISSESKDRLPKRGKTLLPQKEVPVGKAHGKSAAGKLDAKRSAELAAAQKAAAAEAARKKLAAKKGTPAKPAAKAGRSAMAMSRGSRPAPRKSASKRLAKRKPR